MNLQLSLASGIVWGIKETVKPIKGLFSKPDKKVKPIFRVFVFHTCTRVHSVYTKPGLLNLILLRTTTTFNLLPYTEKLYSLFKAWKKHSGSSEPSRQFSRTNEGTRTTGWELLVLTILANKTLFHNSKCFWDGDV